jgi:hypothetical protein
MKNAESRSIVNEKSGNIEKKETKTKKRRKEVREAD